MLLSFGLFLLTALVAASPIDTQKSDSLLKVVLTASGQLAAINAEITNTGASDLALLTYGSFLSAAPVEKVDIYLGGMFIGDRFNFQIHAYMKRTDAKLQFGGILYKYDLNNINPSDYLSRPPLNLPVSTTLLQRVLIASLPVAPSSMLRQELLQPQPRSFHLLDLKVTRSNSQSI